MQLILYPTIVPDILAAEPAGAALGLSNRQDIDTFPTGLFNLSCKSRSPSNRPFAIHSIMLTRQRPMNLSVPTVSYENVRFRSCFSKIIPQNKGLNNITLSRTSTSISFSFEMSKMNSSFQTGFLPPPGFGLEENS